MEQTQTTSLTRDYINFMGYWLLLVALQPLKLTIDFMLISYRILYRKNTKMLKITIFKLRNRSTVQEQGIYIKIRSGGDLRDPMGYQSSTIARSGMG